VCGKVEPRVYPERFPLCDSHKAVNVGRKVIWMADERGGSSHLSVRAKTEPERFRNRSGPVPDPFKNRSEPVRFSGTGPERFQNGSRTVDNCPKRQRRGPTPFAVHDIGTTWISEIRRASCSLGAIFSQGPFKCRAQTEFLFLPRSMRIISSLCFNFDFGYFEKTLQNCRELKRHSKRDFQIAFYLILFL